MSTASEDNEVKDFSSKSAFKVKPILAGVAALVIVAGGAFYFLTSGDDESEQTAEESAVVEDAESESSNNPDDYPKYRPIPPEDAPVQQVPESQDTADDSTSRLNNEMMDEETPEEDSRAQ